MASGDTRKVILKNTDDEILIPYTEVASSTTAGRVKPDGTTTTVDANGVISVTGKQDTLVSGTNIKTVNGNSLLGSGNISISAQASWGNVTGALSNQTDLQNELNAKANDSAVVKLTGNQTVAGIKTFTDNVVVGNVSPLFIARSTKTTRGAYNSSQGENKVVFRDKDNKLLSEMRTYVESSDSATSLCLGVVTEDTNGNQIYKTVFRGTAHKDGTSEVSLGSVNAIYGVTPATADNSTKIATTAYVKAQGYALDSAAVHKAGAETFTGIKTLQAADDDGWYIKKANGDYTAAAPTVQVQGSFRVVDKNNKIMGDVRFTRTTAGTQVAQLLARNAVTGSDVNCMISCNVDKNGNVWTYAPTPATSDNSTKIATTAYFRNNMQVVSALPASPTAGVFYFVKE